MTRSQCACKWLASLLVCALVGSLALTPPALARAAGAAPDLTAVQPGQVANDVDTPIEITGTGFANAGDGPQVYLGATVLRQVTWVSASILKAVVPWGLAPGTYDLRVVNPDGGEATLPGAVRVTQGVGQWQSTAVDGGPVHTVLPIASTPGLLYAHSGVTSGVYRSTDYGAHWTTVGHAGGQFLTDDPTRPGHLYLNAMRSTDGGATWHDLLGGLWPGTDRWPGRYAQVFPSPDGVLFLAAAAIENPGEAYGLVRSADGGQSWQAAEAGLLPGDTHVTAMAFGTGVIYLGTRGGNLYRSPNGGALWQRIGSAPVLESIGLLEINPYAPDELWLTTHFAATAQAAIAIMDLSDPGHALTPVSSWSPESYPRTLGFLGPDTAFIGTNWDNGWLSEDDGASWRLFRPSTGKAGYCLVLDPWDPDQETFYIADEQYGVQKTTDGGLTWAAINQGLHAMSPDSLQIDPANPARVYAKIAENGWPGIFVSDDGGQSWTFSSLEAANDGQRPTTSMLAVSGERVYVGAHGQGPWLFISEDQGLTWRRQGLAPVPAYADSFHMPWFLRADPRQPDTLLLGVVIGNRSMTADEFVSEIYRSTDGGDTWQRLDLAGQVGHAVHNLRDLAFAPHDPNIVYASADHEILKSVDNGRTWASILRNDSVILGGPVAIEPVAPHRIYVGERVSRNGGATWEPAGLPFGAQCMAFVPESDTLYIAGGGGLAVSPDGGSTWEMPEGPLAGVQITGLAVGRVDQRTVVYVGTPGGEAPAAPQGAAGLNALGSSSLEAGVYRLTQIHARVALPLVWR